MAPPTRRDHPSRGGSLRTTSHLGVLSIRGSREVASSSFRLTESKFSKCRRKRVFAIAAPNSHKLPFHTNSKFNAKARSVHLIRTVPCVAPPLSMRTNSANAGLKFGLLIKTIETPPVPVLNRFSAAARASGQWLAASPALQLTTGRFKRRRPLRTTVQPAGGDGQWRWPATVIIPSGATGPSVNHRVDGLKRLRSRPAGRMSLRGQRVARSRSWRFPLVNGGLWQPSGPFARRSEHRS